MPWKDAGAAFFLMHRVGSIQIEIQVEHVHARLSQKSKLAAFGVLLHQRAHVLLPHASLVGHSRNLKIRCCWRNMRIET